MSTDYGMLKLLEYIGGVVKEPMNVKYFEKTEHEVFFPAVKKLVISPLFFRGDNCHSCGRCCKNYTQSYTNEGLKRIKSVEIKEFTKWGLDDAVRDELQNILIKKSVIVNNEKKDWFVFTHDKPVSTIRRSCMFNFERDSKWLCKIHPIKPLSCLLPHIVISTNKNTSITHLRKQQFGRNWYIGCPTEFNSFDYEQFKSWDIMCLNIWNEIAEDLGVKTYLPEILNYFKQKDSDFKKGIVPTKPIEFKLSDYKNSLF